LAEVVRLHCRLIQMFELIELRDRHQTVQPASRGQHISRQGFSRANKRLDRFADLVRCDQTFLDRRSLSSCMRALGNGPYA
jgi:hypothetical protein